MHAYLEEKSLDSPYYVLIRLSCVVSLSQEVLILPFLIAQSKQLTLTVTISYSFFYIYRLVNLIGNSV